jgi:colanic acid/amylovoran biosynthesis glycosyltransferase
MNSPAPLHGPLHGQLHLTYLVSVHPYLSQSFILREVLGLRRLGIDVDVISISAPNRPLAEMSAEERTEVARTWYVKGAGPAVWLRAHLSLLLRHPWRYLRAFGAALRLGGPHPLELLLHLFYFLEAGVIYWRLQRTGHTHIHAHFVSSAGVLVPRFGPVDLSITVHGPDEFFDASRFRLTEKVRAARFVRVISSFTRSQLMRITGEWDASKYVVARLGVDPELFQPAAFRPAPDPFTILCVGRLITGKGQRDLVAAIHALRAKGLPVVLRLVGAGPDRAALEGLIARLNLGAAVTLEGGVNQDRIRAYYESADLFALPSYAEGLPVVLMEAMAMGIACVSTRINGIPELIEDGVSGLLVAPSDVAALEAALDRLIGDTAMRQRLAVAGRAKVLRDYNLGANVAALADLFRNRLG